MRCRLSSSVICIALAFGAVQTALGDSWFRANPEFVKSYAAELADKTRPAEQRLEAVTGLRILLTVYGAHNFDPALRTLKTVRHEPGKVGAAAAELLADLQTALKRRDKRIPNAPVVLGPTKSGIER